MNDRAKFDAAIATIETEDVADPLVLRELEELTRSIDDIEDRSDVQARTVGKLIESQHADAANTIAALIEQPFERSEAFNSLAEYYLSQGEKLASKECLDEARRAGIEVTELWQKSERLARVAKVYFDFGLPSEALSLWDLAVEAAREGEQRLPDQFDCGSVLKEISGMLDHAGYPEKAKAIATSIINDSRRNLALKQMIDFDQE